MLFHPGWSQRASQGRGRFNQALEDKQELIMRISGGTAFLAEGTAGARAPQLERALSK